MLNRDFVFFKVVTAVVNGNFFVKVGNLGNFNKIFLLRTIIKLPKMTEVNGFQNTQSRRK